MRHAALGLCSVGCALMVLIAACDGAPNTPSGDAALQTSLVGHWQWRFTDVETEREIHVRTSRRSDGTWDEEAEERAPSDASAARRLYARAGTWLVSERVLKTHTTVMDGMPVGRNSRLAFQTYPIIEVSTNQVSYRVSPENGRPGQWPRVIELPRAEPTAPVTIIERRVPQ